MLSVRSSCDAALRRSDWRRFWPLLFLYGAVWMMALPLGLWNRRWSIENADTLQDALRRVDSYIYDMVIAAVVISAIFAVLLAMTLYGYLMNSRSVGLMHALPANRTKQFFNHFLVGVEIFTLVHVLTVLLTVLVQSGHGFISWNATLTWLAVAELTSLFFFAFATLCAMVTGWIIAIPVIYVGVNAMFVAFYALLQAMFDEFYWGYNSGGIPAAISWLTPIYNLVSAASDTHHYDESLNQVSYYLSPEGWTALIVYTIVAVVFVAVSWLFYKARRSESAGDAIVFDWLRPIVLYVISVVGGMGFGFLLYYLLDLDGGESLVPLLICQIIAGIVVYFAVQMLLQKSFKVFNRRGWLGALVLAIILSFVGIVVKFDLLGYERYVPQEEKIESVDFGGTMMADYIYTDDDECIEKITAIHHAILAHGKTEEWEWEENSYTHSFHFSFTYNLTNGTYVHRNYSVLVEEGSELHKAMNALLNTDNVYAESYFRGYDPERVSFISGGYYSKWNEESSDHAQLTQEQAVALYRAVGQHIERKSREFIDVMELGYFNYGGGGTTFNLEFHFVAEEYESNVMATEQVTTKPSVTYAVDMPVDEGYYDTWYLHTIPADCTEVMDVLVELGIAESRDVLLYGKYN